LSRSAPTSERSFWRSSRKRLGRHLSAVASQPELEHHDHWAGDHSPQIEHAVTGSVKAIADVRVGDRVEAIDPLTGGPVIGTVTATYRNQDQQFADITVLGTDHKLHQLETTQHHRFWDVTRNAWVFALDLAPGDELLAADGSLVTIESISTYQGTEVMYDLTVDSVHDFFITVAGTSLLVHNCDGAPVSREISVDTERFGPAADHMKEACGDSFCATYDPAGAAARREANLDKSGLPPKLKFDRDEAPMAVFQESVNASVRYVESGPNRSLGAYVGRKLLGLNPGDVVRITISGGGV
jgi:hypothetical protein